MKRLAGALGAEVSGIKLASADEGDIAEIKRLLNEHMVLFFPDQNMNQDDHVALGKPFGPLEGHPNLPDKNIVQHPEIFELVASQGGIADEWHTDLTFLAQPAKMSILNMVKCPDTGGDTMWSNLCAAFDALSPPMQEMCEGLSALHDAHPHGREDRMAIHPVVRVHPADGRKALYISEHFTRRIVEMSAPESDNFLRFLTNWVQSPRFTVRYHWTAGTIGMWDNSCTQHYVLNDFDGERVIQRVTVMGDQPDGPSPRWQPWPEVASRSAMSRHDRQLSHFLRHGSAEAAE
ncbi:MAG: taurine dioxygenase [Rhodospirillaceae bacterium]|nr:taurine dioxygenase [Rhodospirillaceae bacterium]MBT5195595.1 taurine dioxygenase [Rhodospirillaceae bacterium]MBT6426342.1 taurine dioxygenase [Rhodospirillaceae bacterium]MBT7758557.1 taurine dioxygenase [Rhodospirillaceae bacterium]